MVFALQLPDWLVGCFRIALLGEIYPDIVAIAVGYRADGNVLIRSYLDRPPKEVDFHGLEVVATNLDALGGKQSIIDRIDIQCVSLEGKAGAPDPLSGFVYYRKRVD